MGEPCTNEDLVQIKQWYVPIFGLKFEWGDRTGEAEEMHLVLTQWISSSSPVLDPCVTGLAGVGITRKMVCS